VAEDSEAFRRVQEMDLMRRGIMISESTRKKKTAKVTSMQKAPNVIEQNKLKSKIVK
jgi:hypothetical protein